MRCVLHFGDWKEDWWIDRLSMRVDGDPALMEGLQAYALEHANTECRFKQMLEGKWASILKRAQVVLDDLASSVR